jgi:hypothetical protein
MVTRMCDGMQLLVVVVVAGEEGGGGAAAAAETMLMLDMGSCAVHMARSWDMMVEDGWDVVGDGGGDLERGVKACSSKQRMGRGSVPDMPKIAPRVGSGKPAKHSKREEQEARNVEWRRRA